jgi:hypothetical protein
VFKKSSSPDVGLEEERFGAGVVQHLGHRIPEDLVVIVIKLFTAVNLQKFVIS